MVAMLAGCGVAAGPAGPAGSAPAGSAGQLPTPAHGGTLIGAPGAGHATPAAAVKGKSARGTAAAGATPPGHFGTLPPGATLPSDARCAAWVRARPLAENKGANRRFNLATGQHVGSRFFPGGGDGRANALLAPRIDGNFTGATAQILRWAACK